MPGLLDLPSELLEQIFEYLPVSTVHVRTIPCRITGLTEVCLLNKSLHEIATRLLYSSTVITYSATGGFNEAPLIRPENHSGVQHIRHLRFDEYPTNDIDEEFIDRNYILTTIEGFIGRFKPQQLLSLCLENVHGSVLNILYDMVNTSQRSIRGLHLNSSQVFDFSEPYLERVVLYSKSECERGGKNSEFENTALESKDCNLRSFSVRYRGLLPSHPAEAVVAGRRYLRNLRLQAVWNIPNRSIASLETRLDQAEAYVLYAEAIRSAVKATGEEIGELGEPQQLKQLLIEGYLAFDQQRFTIQSSGAALDPLSLFRLDGLSSLTLWRVEGCLRFLATTLALSVTTLTTLHLSTDVKIPDLNILLYGLQTPLTSLHLRIQDDEFPSKTAMARHLPMLHDLYLRTWGTLKSNKVMRWVHRTDEVNLQDITTECTRLRELALHIEQYLLPRIIQNPTLTIFRNIMDGYHRSDHDWQSQQIAEHLPDIWSRSDSFEHLSKAIIFGERVDGANQGRWLPETVHLVSVMTDEKQRIQWHIAALDEREARAMYPDSKILGFGGFRWANEL